MYANIGGTYKKIEEAFVNIDEVWKRVEKVFGNIGGAWREIWAAYLPNAYVGYWNKTMSKLDFSGECAWVYTFNSAVLSTAVDSDGYVYGGTSGNTRKINKDGGLVWQYSGMSYGYNCCAVGLDGHVYVGGYNNTADKEEIHKVTSGGVNVWLWRSTRSDTTQDVAVDVNNYVYGIGFYGDFRKINSSGNQVWTAHAGTTRARDIAVDLNCSVYIVGEGGICKKYDSTGEHVWSYTGFGSSGSEGEVLSIAVDDNFIYAASYYEVHRLKNSGVKVGEYIHGHATRDIAVDKKGYIYMALSSGMEKRNIDDEIIWTYIPEGYKTDGACAVDPGVYGAGFWS